MQEIPDSRRHCVDVHVETHIQDCEPVEQIQGEHCMSYPSSPRCSEHSPVYISGPATVCLVHRESAAPPELPKPSQAPRSHQSSALSRVCLTLHASRLAILPQLTTNRPSPDHLNLARNHRPLDFHALQHLHTAITEPHSLISSLSAFPRSFPLFAFSHLFLSIKSLSRHHQSPFSFSPLNPLI